MQLLAKTLAFLSPLSTTAAVLECPIRVVVVCKRSSLSHLHLTGYCHELSELARRAFKIYQSWRFQGTIQSLIDLPNVTVVPDFRQKSADHMSWQHVRKLVQNSPAQLKSSHHKNNLKHCFLLTNTWKKFKWNVSPISNKNIISLAEACEFYEYNYFVFNIRTGSQEL